MGTEYRVTHGYTELGWHPQAILAQIRNAPLKSGWQVIQGKKRSYTRQLFQGWTIRSALVYLGICAVFTVPMMVCSGLLGVNTLIVNTSYHATFWEYLPIFALSSFLESSIGLSLLFLMYAAIYDIGSHTPLIVILPNGCIEFDQIDKVHAGIVFANLRGMRIRPENDPANVSPPLELTFTDGVTATWAPLTPCISAVLDAYHAWERQAILPHS